MSPARLPAASTPPWQQARTDPAPSLPLPDEVDVCVIGAGIAGMATAAMLNDLGRTVAVVESRRPGSGTTGHSSAKVTVLHGHHGERIADIHDPQAAATYLSANQWGFDWISTLAGQLGDCRWETRPAITYAVDDANEAAIVREHQLLGSAGIGSHLESKEMPWGTHRALVCPDQAQFDPQRFLDLLTQQLDASGASVHTSTTVTGISERSNHVEVRTSSGTTRAAHVVVTTNLPIVDRGLHFARTEPQTSHVVGVQVRHEPPPGMYLSAGGPLRSIRTAIGADGERIVLVGGEGHRTGTVTDTLERQRTLVDWAATHLDVTAVTHRFSAQDYTTPDLIPFAGPIHPGSRRVHTITGLNKWGFTNAPAAAAIIAAHIVRADVRPAWSELYSASRVPLAGATELARAGVSVAVQAVTGWTTSLSKHPLRPGQPIGSGPRRPCVASGVCTHLGGIVRWNDAAQTWDCPLHGSRFTDAGTVEHAPATTPLRGTDTGDGSRRAES